MRSLHAFCVLSAWVLAGCISLLANDVQGQEVAALVDKQQANLLATYKSLHAAPELSHHEDKTSALLAGELRAAVTR